jgi:hypothetical protein
MRRAHPTVMLVSAGLAVSVLASRAACAEPERVLVVAEDTGSVLVRTLTSELAGGGFDVQIVSVAVAVDLSSEAGARHARTVLRVSPTNASIDLWMADHEGSEVRFRERIEAGSANEGPSLLAIRVQEAVRAKLLPVAPLVPQEPQPAASEKPVPAPAPPTEAPTAPRRFSASVGPSVLGSPGGTSPMGEVALGFSWLASEHWLVEAMARIPVLPGRVDGREGVARVALAAARRVAGCRTRSPGGTPWCARRRGRASRWAGRTSTESPTRRSSVTLTISSRCCPTPASRCACG